MRLMYLRLSVTVLFTLLLGSIKSLHSCHQCKSVALQTLSTDEAKYYRSRVDRCFDYDGTTACVSNLQQGLCDLNVLEMKARCNDTCDLCRFKESGEMQLDDIKYWNTQRDFYDDFINLNVSLVSVESSTYVDRDGLDAYNVIDGNLTTFFETEYASEPFIVVNLGSSYSVYNVYVVNRWGENISRRNIISLDYARISAELIPPVNSKTTGNTTYCGEIRIRGGFTLDEQSYKIPCSSRPISTHVKLYRVDYNKIEVTEIKVAVMDDDDQCGKTISSQCNPYLGNDQCYKSVLTGIWHGKRIVYTMRGCHYPSQINDTTCPNIRDHLNKRWEHLKSEYIIDGAYDPNSFAMTTCDHYLCDGDQCNGIDKLSDTESYLIILLLAFAIF